MISIRISEEMRKNCPLFSGTAIYTSIKNSEHNNELWELIDNEITAYKSSHSIETVNKHPVIAATRAAYKQLGKDPNRYRPSSEALGRRIVRELPLYKINTVVDVINLVSIHTGYSIGGFDADKIKGNVLTLGIGCTDEPYESIGRGMLNIEGLPVYRDEIGGVGTPTSDSERTKLNIETTRLLTIINGFNGKKGLDEAVEYMLSLLQKFAFSANSRILYF